MEVPDMNWRKSTYSSNGGGECVETATGNGLVLVRDTANQNGPRLAVNPTAWAAFTASLR